MTVFDDRKQPPTFCYKWKKRKEKQKVITLTSNILLCLQNSHLFKMQIFLT